MYQIQRKLLHNLRFVVTSYVLKPVDERTWWKTNMHLHTRHINNHTLLAVVLVLVFVLPLSTGSGRKPKLCKYNILKRNNIYKIFSTIIFLLML